MLISYLEASGVVVYNGPKMKVLKITSSPFGTIGVGLSPTVLKSNISKIPIISGSSDIGFKMGVRFPEYIFAFDNNTILSRDNAIGPNVDDFKSFKDEVIARPFISEICRLSRILDCYTEKETGNISLNGLVRIVRFDPMTMKIITRNTGIQHTKLVIDDQTFTLEKDSTEDDNKESFHLHFLNEFENITFAQDDPNFDSIVGRISERMNLSRVCPHYTIYRSTNSYRNTMSYRDIKPMKIDEMVRFFGNQKKSNTKIDTLTECLKSWTSKHATDCHVGEVYMIQLMSRGTTQTDIESMPIDWILCYATRMKVLCSESVDKWTTSIFVQITDKFCDDFIHNLFSVIENDNTGGINMVCINQEKIKAAISRLRVTDKSGNIVSV